MKICYFGICFTLWVCLEAKEVRHIVRSIPLEDWIEFKTRTRDVKPIDKLIGKLRATYDFVFHKPENVSNVGKILDESAQEERSKINSTDSLFERRTIKVDTMEDKEESDKTSNIQNISSRPKSSSNDWLDDEFDNFDKMEKLEKLDDDDLTLEHLEIVDDQDSLETFDEEPEKSDDKSRPPHSNFALPYAIAQALLRWLISLYYSTSSTLARTDTVTRESA